MLQLTQYMYPANNVYKFVFLYTSEITSLRGHINNVKESFLYIWIFSRCYADTASKTVVLPLIVT